MIFVTPRGYVVDVHGSDEYLQRCAEYNRRAHERHAEERRLDDER